MRRLSSVSVLLFLTFSLFAQDSTQVFDFAVRPGTSEWEKLSTYEARLNALQIPNSKIDEMSTISLLESCLNYPIIWFLFSNQTVDIGFRKWRNEFLALNQFYNRNNRANSALKFYDNFKIDSYLNYERDLEQTRSIFNHVIIELIICQKEIFDMLNNEQCHSLLNRAVQNYYLEKADKRYSSMGIASTGRLIIKLLRKTNSSEPLLKDSSIQFIEKAGIITNVDILDSLVKNIVK